jgi:hypothetical protein
VNRIFNSSFTTFGLVILVAVIIASMNIDARAASANPVPPLLVYGEVEFDGIILLGDGFSVNHIAEGVYKLTFTDASGSTYNPKICTASPVNSQCIAAALPPNGALNGLFEVDTSFVGSDGSFFQPTNCGFTFICIK